MGTVVKVELTQRLRNNLIAAGVDTDYFATYFGAWKALGAKGEFLDPYFGKDAFYAKPLRITKWSCGMYISHRNKMKRRLQTGRKKLNEAVLRQAITF